MNARLLKRGLLVTLVLSALTLTAAIFLPWRSIVFSYRFEELGENEQGYPEYRHRSTGIVFVGLPGGAFTMGSPADEPGRRDDEGPAHSVTVSPFLIAKYEVTQEEWSAVMETNRSTHEGDELPVHRVSWNDVQRFEEKTGLSLPTEAQWEYACRAGTTTPYAFGESLILAQAIISMRIVPGRPEIPPVGIGRAIRVGSYPANACGLHDMHGNGWEWFEDEYAPYSPEYRDGDVPRRVEAEAGAAVRHVLRGGAFHAPPEVARNARRFAFRAGSSSTHGGFRPIYPDAP